CKTPIMVDEQMTVECKRVFHTQCYRVQSLRQV
uniref:BAH domain-containing protein n=1 Tax=Globodera pallida TaxID=36090 RepID=A0A183CSS5_GLOPA